MSRLTAISAPRIFDGSSWHAGCAIILDGQFITQLVPRSALSADIECLDLDSGFLAPGFLDLQVNGGDGVLFNNDPSVAAIERICKAHARFGTTALLPTLITDTPETMAMAIFATAEAMAQSIPGCLGLHLEGPHLSRERRGAHDADLVRPADDTDISNLIATRENLGNLLVTMAPESVNSAQIGQLAQAGVRVSLGHSNASCKDATALMRSGASMVTHLFNAMSPLGHREPGMVGAALSEPGVFAGIIADGIHVDPVSMQIALRAKEAPGQIFLVTDAMSTIGSDQTSFTLNGRTVYRANGRLTLENGTLAGADIDMVTSVRNIHTMVGLPLEEALRMASIYPARAMKVDDQYGWIGAGSRADIIRLSDDLDVRDVWIGGKPLQWNTGPSKA